MIFSIRLKALRKEQGIQQKALAAYLHISTTALSNYEAGKHQPCLDILRQIADFYDVSADYLLGRTTCKSWVKDPDQPSNGDLEESSH